MDDSCQPPNKQLLSAVQREESVKVCNEHKIIKMYGFQPFLGAIFRYLSDREDLFQKRRVVI